MTQTPTASISLEPPASEAFSYVGPDIMALITECGRIAHEKEFRSDFHRTQIALIATAVAEALEYTSPSRRPLTDSYAMGVCSLSGRYKQYQQVTTAPYEDGSVVIDEDRLYEELADIIIRCFSYAGGNGKGLELVAALVAKIQKNAERPPLHGKAF